MEATRVTLTPKMTSQRNSLLPGVHHTLFMVGSGYVALKMYSCYGNSRVGVEQAKSNGAHSLSV